jgi:hypothetical protein
MSAYSIIPSDTTTYRGRHGQRPVRIAAEGREIVGWVKSTGGLDQLKVRGIEKAKTTFVLGLEDRCPLFGIML